ncbi:polynucleotide 5'-hydroxyl-kinase NOL9 isoform X1 [Cynara cardunculus var. scolymus]|uniref:Pre-mRNA cleavage complex II Clp1 n=1 Tax=Cynara cardunculus var. scolymus TaxID=59895 RepID=A0A124SE30_CYNCS|nr:polynucleotide 5'-hydroxyl-kinase NOL9 isoform X1 [Cynara cardunculus var. scolymus]XP_024972947.1 polynucleotide 5'-hydroxyl-kinase NOL9 isoform X1 [Cynara cardunculus var. scolymus]XP_024972948.1 polynucleotide 5'-hydroxyl-kinase NOL9 isoform X1 [Cynara cardunculus var. scolymus]KVH98815.1 Pre-mRNA cleavage complex II Clp1 [Cynara cardunculus var. scolymus]
MAMASLMEVEESEATNIYIPEEWSEAADTIVYGGAQTPVAFICGPKNSGKSTFSRHLLHLLLRRYERVAYLDTDVGQPEFTPPGCLSLTVLDRETIDLKFLPERCFFFGDISSKRDPEIYLTYIFALYDHYHKQHHELSRSASPGKSGVPLIVNTPGWVKGIGYDLLVDMLKHIAPSHVVNICISAKSKNLPSGAFWSQDGDAGAVTLIEINSARQDSLNRSVLVQKDSRHLRDLSIVTYFRQCFPSDMSISTIKEVARALAAHPPYEVPVSAVSIKHLHCEVPKDEIFYSLNATIVGLAVNSEDSGHLPRCVGLGIVRGVDILRRVLYIITPVPQNVVEDVDVLLQGFIQIPTYLLQVQGSVSPYMASNVLPGI